ncbi:bestrophin family protein [Achromobacter aloeverae]|nr:bestrophin family ion channel [Achromobacter aloeverae]
MIVRPKTTWFLMLFAWHGSVLHRVLAPLLVNFLLGVLAVWGSSHASHFFPHLNPVPFSLIGVALAIFVSFRNNACYSRYWEARTLWGGMKNQARDFARFVITVPDLHKDDPQVARVLNLMVAFIYALKHQLRDTDPRPSLVRLLDENEVDQILRRDCRPQYVLECLQRQLVAWHRQGRYGDIMLESGLRKLDALNAVLGGCERIRGTPLPYAYDVLLHRTTYFYCALLPFGLIGSIGLATPVISVFIAYAFLAWHAIASELEDPFGEEPNDLALTSMSIDAERAVRQAVDAKDMPPRLMPDLNFRLR